MNDTYVCSAATSSVISQALSVAKALITCSHFATKGSVDTENRRYDITDLLRNVNLVFEMFFIMAFYNNTCPLQVYRGKEWVNHRRRIDLQQRITTNFDIVVHTLDNMVSVQSYLNVNCIFSLQVDGIWWIVSVGIFRLKNGHFLRFFICIKFANVFCINLLLYFDSPLKLTYWFNHDFFLSR